MTIPHVEPDSEMKPEYDLRDGVRGKYASRYAEGSNVVILDPDVAAVFPDSVSVNDALRALSVIIQQRTVTRSTVG